MSTKKQFPQERNRKSIRLQSYDYKQPGFYFITICTYQRRHLFGEVINGEMNLNQFGNIASMNWVNTKNIRDNVKMGAFVIMPNHMHAVFEITNLGKCKMGECDSLLPRDFKSPSNSVGAIVRGYKSTVTKQINQIRGNTNPKIWHRNYYEHIVRDQESLNKISEYIEMNPRLWDKDWYYQ